MMRSTVEHSLSEDDKASLVRQLQDVDAGRLMQNKSVTIIEIGRCWVKIEDGVLKLGCDV